MITCSVRVHGHVQGVAFRKNTTLRARELGVNGWVRNQPDGSVEGLFEGEQNAVKALIEWCHSGPPAASVQQVEVSEERFTGQFTGFDITY